MLLTSRLAVPPQVVALVGAEACSLPEMLEGDEGISSDTEGFAIEVDLPLFGRVTPRIAHMGETNVLGVDIERDMVQEGADGYSIVVASSEILDSNFASPWVEGIVLELRPPAPGSYGEDWMLLGGATLVPTHRYHAD